MQSTNDTNYLVSRTIQFEPPIKIVDWRESNTSEIEIKTVNLINDKLRNLIKAILSGNFGAVTSLAREDDNRKALFHNSDIMINFGKGPTVVTFTELAMYSNSKQVISFVVSQVAFKSLPLFEKTPSLLIAAISKRIFESEDMQGNLLEFAQKNYNHKDFDEFSEYFFKFFAEGLKIYYQALESVTHVRPLRDLVISYILPLKTSLKEDISNIKEYGTCQGMFGF